MVLDKELKDAISQLTSTEKDKLIFRLLKRDLDLANRLYFELISADSKEDRRKEAQKRIESLISRVQQHIQHFTPGLLLIEMRGTSGIINEHVKITKDKYGEVYLQLFILKEFLKICNQFFLNSSPNKSYTLYIYFVSRAFKVLVLMKKMHDDLLTDFEDDVIEIGNLFNSNANLMKIATHNKLDVNWLINAEIPENIADIEKDIRKRGYLK